MKIKDALTLFWFTIPPPNFSLANKEKEYASGAINEKL